MPQKISAQNVEIFEKSSLWVSLVCASMHYWYEFLNHYQDDVSEERRFAIRTK
jgi:hypothetical protein